MAENSAMPQPDPALRRLDRLVGRWSMDGNLVGSDQKNIKGETAFRWLSGGFFLEQRMQLDFMGLQIDSLELIGYDPRPRPFRRPCSRTCHPPRCPTGGRSRTTP
jgi:hypothetical protein